MKARPWIALALIIALALAASLIAATAGAQSALSPAAGGLFSAYLPAVASELCNDPPDLIAPAQGATLDTVLPLFTWDAGDEPGATATEIRIDIEPEFAPPTTIISIPGGTGVGSYRSVQNLQEGTVYYWRAELDCGDEVFTPFSPLGTFTTGAGGEYLAAPVQLTPADGAVLPALEATFTWTEVAGTVEYLLRYRPESSPDFTYVWTAAPQHTAGDLLPGTRYIWTVAARNDFALGQDRPSWEFFTP
jgi:hypothetical protein